MATAHPAKLTLIDVPYDCGRYGERMGAGPLALAEPLGRALAAEGIAVEHRPVRLPDGFHAEVAAVQALQPQVRREVAAARVAGCLPVVLAGNCGVAALGACAGLEEPPAVLWLDAHADFNTPETSPSGFFDGMALATLTGRCWRTVAQGFEGFTPVPAERVVLLGARDLDDAERDALAASAVTWVRPDAARSGDGTLAAALDRLGRAATLYLHLDLDVLDPAVLRANRYAAPGGMTLEDVEAVLRALPGGLAIGAVGVTAYDPAVDVDGHGPAVVTRLLRAVAAGAG